MGNIPLASSSSESESSDGETELSGSTDTGTDFREKREFESFVDSLLDGIVRNAVESVEMKKKESEGKTFTFNTFTDYIC